MKFILTIAAAALALLSQVSEFSMMAPTTNR
jgi:hypothetical protein